MANKTIGIIPKNITIGEVEECLAIQMEPMYLSKIKITHVVEADLYRITFLESKQQRTMYLHSEETAQHDTSFSGRMLSLGCWGNSVDIITKIVTCFGGYLCVNDAESEDFVLINEEMWIQNSEKEVEVTLDSIIIETLGYNNLEKGRELVRRIRDFGIELRRATEKH